MVRMRTLFIDSHVCLLGHQEGAPLESKYKVCPWSRYDLVGRIVSLGVGFGVLKAQASPSVSLFLLPEDLNVEFSAKSQLRLPACHHAPYYDKNVLNF